MAPTRPRLERASKMSPPSLACVRFPLDYQNTTSSAQHSRGRHQSQITQQLDLEDDGMCTTSGNWEAP